MNETPKPAAQVAAQAAAKSADSALVDVRVDTDNHEHNGVKCKKGDIIRVPPDQADFCEQHKYGTRVSPRA